MKALYPIKQPFVETIFNGSKGYEFRKSVCAKPIGAVVVYESRGRGMVVGEFVVKDIISDTPKELWERTKDKAGICQEDFMAYFKGFKKAYAYVIGKVTVYEKPLLLSDYGITKAPQGYVYIY